MPVIQFEFIDTQIPLVANCTGTSGDIPGGSTDPGGGTICDCEPYVLPERLAETNTIVVDDWDTMFESGWRKGTADSLNKPVIPGIAIDAPYECLMQSNEEFTIQTMFSVLVTQTLQGDLIPLATDKFDWGASTPRGWAFTADSVNFSGTKTTDFGTEVELTFNFYLFETTTESGFSAIITLGGATEYDMKLALVAGAYFSGFTALSPVVHCVPGTPATLSIPLTALPSTTYHPLCLIFVPWDTVGDVPLASPITYDFSLDHLVLGDIVYIDVKAPTVWRRIYA